MGYGRECASRTNIRLKAAPGTITKQAYYLLSCFIFADNPPLLRLWEILLITVAPTKAIFRCVVFESHTSSCNSCKEFLYTPTVYFTDVPPARHSAIRDYITFRTGRGYNTTITW